MYFLRTKYKGTSIIELIIVLSAGVTLIVAGLTMLGDLKSEMEIKNSSRYQIEHIRDMCSDSDYQCNINYLYTLYETEELKLDDKRDILNELLIYGETDFVYHEMKKLDII